MAPLKKSKLWLVIVFVCLAQVVVWTLWIRYASQHRIAEVPLATSR